MPYKVDVRPSAMRALERLPRRDQERIEKRLAALETDLRPPGTVAIHGPERLLRVRVGDNRIIYSVDDARQTVFVERIANRREAYR
ncbi:MAG: type II toxin-antitoxin system RelE/ParE family toxin [Chloroflexia bacterium]|nr:type II toxin-antitoxin system RelE/ParE family toxin [Chloroflexia bacterium]